MAAPAAAAAVIIEITTASEEEVEQINNNHNINKRVASAFECNDEKKNKKMDDEHDEDEYYCDDEGPNLLFRAMMSHQCSSTSSSLHQHQIMREPRVRFGAPFLFPSIMISGGGDCAPPPDYDEVVHAPYPNFTFDGLPAPAAGEEADERPQYKPKKGGNHNNNEEEVVEEEAMMKDEEEETKEKSNHKNNNMAVMMMELRRWLENEIAGPLRFSVNMTRELAESQRRSDYLLTENNILRRHQLEQAQHRTFTLQHQQRLIDQQRQLLHTLQQTLLVNSTTTTTTTGAGAVGCDPPSFCADHI
jgi:hypothetical protein